jgi:hypothetical protein
LQDASLAGANLQETGLHEANLERTNLFRANLQGASLLNAILQGANLRDANMEGVEFEGASFDEATTLPDGMLWGRYTDMYRFTNPKHPDFWRSGWVFSPAYREED